MDFYLISVLVFAAIIAVLVLLDRKNYKRDSIFLLRRTDHGKKFIIGIGERFQDFWKAVGTLAVVVGLLVSFYSVFSLAENVAKALLTQKAMPGMALLLPSLSAEATPVQGVVWSVPFWYWIICIAVLAVVHEGFHGVMAAAEKMKIKKLGFGLLAVIPLAFVEPDEKQVAKKPLMSQLRFFSAGSFANFITAAAFGLLMPLFAVAFFMPMGVAFSTVYTGYPAEAVNMTGTITMIDNYTISNVDQLSVALNEIGPNRTISVITSSFVGSDGLEYSVPKNYGNGEYTVKTRTYTMTTAENPDKPGYGFIGIAGIANSLTLKPGYSQQAGAIQFMDGLIFFMFIINFGVGFANLLPIKPLDGGRIVDEIFKRVSPAHAGKLTKSLGVFTLLLILANFMMGLL